jgi:ribonuclease D
MSPAGHAFWSHNLYRGPQDQRVRVFYSRTKLESEEIAHEFLDEKVIGFDMEWPWETNTTADTRLQRKIGLIQIACEDKIALFHIGLHSGSTAKDLLAPALRKIIEDPAIAKCGVAVHNADFARLQQWFGLRPRGAFELSHLHNLVSFGASKPAKCTTRLTALAAQVEQHLGLPLHKGKVRTSNWSQPLNRDQVNYAAADAYAGFMLFHCINAKRMDMDPVPPLPVYAETYGDAVRRMPPKTLLQLLPVPGSVQPTSVLDFYRQSGEVAAEPDQHSQAADDKKASLSAEGAHGYVRIGRRGKHILSAEAADVGTDVLRQMRGQYATEQQQQRENAPGGTTPHMMAATKSSSLKAKTAGTVVEPGVLDEARTGLLFQELRKHRRDLAEQRKCAPFMIARDTHLHAISRKCPRSHAQILHIHGIGLTKLAECGAAWLAIVKDFVEKSATDDAARAEEDGEQPSSAIIPPLQPELPALHAQLDQPIRSTPVLHTGISFSMQDASLDRKAHDEGSSDNSSAFASPRREQSPSVLKRKREEMETGQTPDPGRGRQLQRKYQAAGEDAELQPQTPPGAVTILGTPQILSGPDGRDTNAAPVLKQTPHINHEGALARHEGTRTTIASVSPLPSAAPSKMDAPQHPAAEVEVRLQPAARQLNANEVQAKILRNKIVAFNKLVTTSVQLPSNTTEHLANKLPKTMQELLQVPGIMPFANACSRANRDLLGFLARSAPAKG